MRTKTTYAILLLIFLSLCGVISCSHTAIATKDNAAVDPAADSNWVFTAVTVMPQVGTTGPVNGNYTVSFIHNKLSVYLPYFGRAYGGSDVFTAKNPLDFMSSDLTVNRMVKKNGEEIIFKPNDHSEVQSMDINLYIGGKANLNINMSTRSGISFSGNFRPVQ